MQEQIDNAIPTDSGEKYNAVQNYRIKFTERAEHDVNIHANNLDGVLAEVEKRESQQHQNSDKCEIPMKEILSCYNEYIDVLKCSKYVKDFQECSRKL